MEVWRLIESPPGAGDWNMAVDAALMESVAAGGICCLRFYSWSEPTVSLGYFQEKFEGKPAVSGINGKLDIGYIEPLAAPKSVSMPQMAIRIGAGTP